MKNLIARIDAIEKGKKYISESAAPVVEYKGGTDAEKIKNWQKHIDQFKEKGMYKAADDAEQSAKRAQPGFKPARSRDKPTKEGSIARALMKEFGVYDDIRPVNEFSDKIGNYFRQNAADYKARQASGELPPDGWNQETDGPWYGKNPNAEPVRDGSGQPVRVASGGNLQTTSPQGQRKTGDQWNPANAGGHAQGFNNDPSGPGLPTTIGSPAPMVVPPGPQPGTGDANVAQAMANQPATNGGQNVVPGKTGPNGEPIQTSQGRPGYYDAKTRKWTPVKEGKVNIPEDDRILNMIRSIKI